MFLGFNLILALAIIAICYVLLSLLLDFVFNFIPI